MEKLLLKGEHSGGSLRRSDLEKKLKGRKNINERGLVGNTYFHGV